MTPIDTYLRENSVDPRLAFDATDIAERIIDSGSREEAIAHGARQVESLLADYGDALDGFGSVDAMIDGNEEIRDGLQLAHMIRFMEST